jgi:Kef-type K+ transport system membrane component KefB
MSHLLSALLIVIVLARVFGLVLHRFGQPRVIGEVIAGIALGPSVLGRVSPDSMTLLFPTAVLPILDGLAQLGVILYMFLVGLHLDSSSLRSRARATLLVSQASIAVPFVMGTMLALWLFDNYAPYGVGFTSFSLFFALAIAITAFPVLSRILTDQGIDRTELGVFALSCAAAGDVTAWCLLAIVVGVVQADISSAVSTIGLTFGYVAVMVGVVWPCMRSRLEKSGPQEISADVLAVVLMAVLASSLATEMIGIHALFGAFVVGAILPHDGELASCFDNKLSDAVNILLMPVFFAYTGLRTQLGLLSEPGDWVACAAIIVVATAAKFGGTFMASRFTGLDWRKAASLGVLMNTRGLMELIVLNIGLDLGILSPRLFAMMVLMALATTIATTPWLNLLQFRGEPVDGEASLSRSPRVHLEV